MVLPYWIHNVDHVHNISTSNDKQYVQQAIEQIYEEVESAVLQCVQLVLKQTCQKQGPVVRRFLYIYIYTSLYPACIAKATGRPGRTHGDLAEGPTGCAAAGPILGVDFKGGSYYSRFRLGFWDIILPKDIIPPKENRMEKNMDNEIEAGWVNLGLRGIMDCRGWGGWFRV